MQEENRTGFIALGNMICLEKWQHWAWLLFLPVGGPVL